MDVSKGDSEVQAVITWREFLGAIIKNPDDRQRLANTLGVCAITLNRWVSGVSKPRVHNLQNLLDALPQSQRGDLLPLLSEEFPDFTPMRESDERAGSSQREIPSSFYAQFFKEYTSTNLIQRYWTLCNLVLQQALTQLDPDQQGMAIALNQCMKPAAGQKVRTIHVCAGLGTPPWPRHLELHASFLGGAESLAGYVISSGHSVVIQSRAEQGSLPVHWIDMEESVAAYPLLLSGRIAGCLTCSSTQPGHFLSERRTLLQRYAELLVLVCDRSDFYAFEDLDLHFMPDYHKQLEYLSNLQQRVIDEMHRADRKLHPLTVREAEQRVWQHVEEELLRVN